MKKLLTRALTGTLFVAIIVISLVTTSSLYFLGVFSLITVLGLLEFYHLTQPNREKLSLWTDVIGGLILFGCFYWKFSDPRTDYLWIAPYLGYLIVKMVMQLYMKLQNPVADMAYGIFGQIYIAIPLALLNLIYFEIGTRVLLALFILIWINDTGAFCVGSLIGKRRLFERISPKKSWEGFFGGIIFSIGAAILFGTVFNKYFHNISLEFWIGFAVVITLFATWGDLFESLIKRTLHVKDSGKLLPGHGGILDRIDSLLLVAPAVILYFIIISHQY